MLPTAYQIFKKNTPLRICRETRKRIIPPHNSGSREERDICIFLSDCFRNLFERDPNGAESHPADFPDSGFCETLKTGIRSLALFCLHAIYFLPGPRHCCFSIREQTETIPAPAQWQIISRLESFRTPIFALRDRCSTVSGGNFSILLINSLEVWGRL